MPVIKSAIKRARQAEKSTARNRQVLSHMRSLIKNMTLWTKTGEKKKAEETFALTQKAIDMAAKKNLIHKNNAARKKSSLAEDMKKAGLETKIAATVSKKRTTAEKAAKTAEHKAKKKTATAKTTKKAK